MFELTDELIAALRLVDTPTVCNALELLVPERRGYGFTTRPLVCTRPDLGPVVGIARTATIRAAHPSDSNTDQAAVRDSYYAYIDAGPKPSVVVIQDLDEERGYGSFWGEVNSNIHKGLGCDAVITNGSVRDLPDIADGFQMLADRVGPSHAFVHVVDFCPPRHRRGHARHRRRRHPRRPARCGGHPSRGLRRSARGGRPDQPPRASDHLGRAAARLRYRCPAESPARGGEAVRRGILGA